MAHNRSPSRLRSDVLAGPIEVYRGWVLEVECGTPGCPVGRSHRVEALAGHYPGLTVGEVIDRLRCVACGQGPRNIVLAEAVRRRRVPLRGVEVAY